MEPRSCKAVISIWAIGSLFPSEVLSQAFPRLAEDGCAENQFTFLWMVEEG